MGHCIFSSVICVVRASVCFLIGLLFLLVVVSCMSCEYILEIKPFLVALFADIFSHFSLSFHLLKMVSFLAQ